MSEISLKLTYPWRTVLWSWLLVGTLDITAALVNYWIGGGRNPISVFVYIASGVFGQTAFEVGVPVMAWWGLIFHYLIALIWTAFFFLIYPKFGFLSRNWVLTGVIYGAFIWLMMNRVVLQLANTPKGPFRVTGAIINCLILIAMIGLPLAYIARRRATVT